MDRVFSLHNVAEELAACQAFMWREEWREKSIRITKPVDIYFTNLSWFTVPL